MSLPDTDAPPSDDEEDHSKQILTAIYRPDSKAAWREELRAANEMAEKVRRYQGFYRCMLTQNACLGQGRQITSSARAE